MSNIFLIVMALFYIATWGLDWSKLRKATGLAKGMYYTIAVSVLGLYLATFLQIDLVLPTHWVVYTWSDWLHGILSS